jgi:hypothetical protein
MLNSKKAAEKEQALEQAKENKVIEDNRNYVELSDRERKIIEKLDRRPEK